MIFLVLLTPNFVLHSCYHFFVKKAASDFHSAAERELLTYAISMSSEDFFFTPKPDNRPGRLEFDLQSELAGWEKGLLLTWTQVS